MRPDDYRAGRISRYSSAIGSRRVNPDLQAGRREQDHFIASPRMAPGRRLHANCYFATQGPHADYLRADRNPNDCCLPQGMAGTGIERRDGAAESDYRDVGVDRGVSSSLTADRAR